MLVRDTAVPTISKDVIAGETGIHGSTADYRIRVTIPANKSFEDLHVVDSLNGMLPGETGLDSGKPTER